MSRVFELLSGNESVAGRAEEIAREADTAEATAAMHEMVRRYPVPRSDVEARVFVRFTDNWVELTARFPVPVRQARTVKDAISRRVLERLRAAGIEIASETETITVTREPAPTAGSPETGGSEVGAGA
jgi:small-conductance mechanosensitive channel